LGLTKQYRPCYARRMSDVWLACAGCGGDGCDECDGRGQMDPADAAFHVSSLKDPLLARDAFIWYLREWRDVLSHAPGDNKRKAREVLEWLMAADPTGAVGALWLGAMLGVAAVDAELQPSDLSAAADVLREFMEELAKQGEEDSGGEYTIDSPIEEPPLPF